MPDLDGIAATAALHERFPQVRVVMLTMYDATTHGEAARAAGAVAYVVKSSHPDELFRAIRSAANGAAPLRPAEPLRPIAPMTTSEDDRLAHLERRLRWLEEQLAALAARPAVPAVQPNGSAADVPAPAPAEASAPESPPAQRDREESPVAVPAAAQPRTTGRHRVAPAFPWPWLAAAVALELLAVAGLVLLPRSGTLVPWLTLASGQLASVCSVLAARRGRLRPAPSHLAFLGALSGALFWSVVVARGAGGAVVWAAGASLLAVALPLGLIAWRRDFLAAAALALVAATLVPPLTGLASSWLVLVWVTVLVALATLLAWRSLRAARTQAAWEWLPLAPLVAGSPALLVAGEALAGPRVLALALPWLVSVPVLAGAARAGRRSASVLVAMTAFLAFGTFAWLLRAAAAPVQAIGLVCFSLAATVVAALLWWAARYGTAGRAPAEVAASFAAGALALAAARHPEPLLAPLAWLALAVVLAALARYRAAWQWAGLALLLAGALAAFRPVSPATDLPRFALLVAALALATVSGPVLIARPWWFPVVWLLMGTLALGAALFLRLSGLAGIAASSLLAVGSVASARVVAAQSLPATRRWLWLPAAVAGALAVARAVSGPLSPAQLGLALQPALPATSEPVVAASILVAAALAAGRLLGRRWRWAALATALLVVAYTLPAVIPDAALVVSWLALAVALAQAAGGRPWR